jgi:hypothetical protein
MRDFRRSGLACGSRDRDGRQEREPSIWKSKLICYRFRGIPHFFPLFRTTGNSDRTAAKFTQSLIGGTEAIDHEAETLLTKKAHTTKSVLRLPDSEHAKLQS